MSFDFIGLPNSESFASVRRLVTPIAIIAIMLAPAWRAHADEGLRLDELVDADWLALSFTWHKQVSYEWTVSERELVIRFAEVIPSNFVDDLSAEAKNWIDYLSLGFDSVLIRMKPGVEVDVTQPSGNEVAAAFSRGDRGATESAETSEPDRSDLRFELLRAELLRKSGRLIEARRVMRRELNRNAADTDVLIAMAGIERELGRPEKAVQLYNRALALQPDLKIIAREKARLFRAQGSGTAGDSEIRTGSVVQLVEDEDRQEEHRLFASHRVSQRLKATFAAERRELSSNSVLRSDGSTSPFHGAKHRASLGATYAIDAETEIEAALHVGEGLPGASVAVQKRGLVPANDAVSTLVVDVFEPYWDLVEGIVNEGARSRVRATHRQPLSAELQLSAESGVNTYRVKGEPGVADSVSAGLAATFSPRWLPEGLAVGYQIDGEYVLSRKISTRTDGTTFRPLNVVTRETHTGQLSYNRELALDLNLSLSAGYSYDRFNAKGPSVTAGLQYNPMPNLRAEVSASQSITSSRGGDSTVNRFGVLLSWLF